MPKYKACTLRNRLLSLISPRTYHCSTDQTSVASDPNSLTQSAYLPELDVELRLSNSRKSSSASHSLPKPGKHREPNRLNPKTFEARKSISLEEPKSPQTTHTLDAPQNPQTNSTKKAAQNTPPKSLERPAVSYTTIMLWKLTE